MPASKSGRKLSVNEEWLVQVLAAYRRWLCDPHVKARSTWLGRNRKAPLAMFGHLIVQQRAERFLAKMKKANRKKRRKPDEHRKSKGSYRARGSSLGSG